MFLHDLANFSNSSQNVRNLFRNEKQYQNYLQQLNNAKKERRDPGITWKNSAVNGAVLGAMSPLIMGVGLTSMRGSVPKNVGKNILAKSVTGGLTGAGLSMLLRSRRDLKADGARNPKERRLLRNVGRGALAAGALGGLSALQLRGRGYGLQDFAGKTFNRVTAGAALGSGGAYLGTRLYNRFKNNEKN